MKIINLIALLFVINTYAADQYIVIPWSEAKTNAQERIDGIPLSWPMQTIPVDEKTVIPEGAEVLDSKQIEQRKMNLAEEYAAYEARVKAREAAKDAAVNNAKTALFDLFDEFKAFEDGWQSGTNYTAAQLQTIIRKHNRALIKMRPIIRDLYREE